MISFREANQLRLALKMKFSNYAWYRWSMIVPSTDGFSIIIGASYINNNVRKVVSPVYGGASVKLEVE